MTQAPQRYNHIGRLKDFCQVGDGAHASIARQEHGVMYLSAKNFKSSGLDLINVEYISEGDYEKHFGRTKKAVTTPVKGDVLFGIIGSLGTPYTVKDKDKFGLSSSVAILRPNKDLSPDYLYHFMTSSAFQSAVHATKSGVAQGFLSLEMVKNLPLISHEINVQMKIAAILSAYDELIENNQGRIALLEKMAEEIYREWFVRLRFPGYEKVKFVKGVPEGWRAVQFTEICEFQKGKTPDQTFLENQDGLFPYITVEFIEGKNTEYVLKKRNSIVCENGDVLMLMDGARSGLAFRGKRGVVGSTFARVSVEPIYRDVVYEFLRATREHIVSNNTGSAIPHANKEFIHRLVMFLPENETLVEKFNALYRSLFDQTLNLVSQNELLSRSRDALLPRLISGKLSVENLDIQFPPSMEETAHEI